MPALWEGDRVRQVSPGRPDRFGRIHYRNRYELWIRWDTMDPRDGACLIYQGSARRAVLKTLRAV